jgi:hypothetical protein
VPYWQVFEDLILARKKSSPAPSAPSEPDRSRGALDVATLAPWIAFWGWVALDSALAYRKSQAALEQADEVQADVHDDATDPPASKRRALWSPGARIAMIGAPVIALLGPLVLDRLTRRRKP